MRKGNRGRVLRVAVLAFAGLVAFGCGSSKHCKKYDHDTEVYMDLKASGQLSSQGERFARLQAIASRHSLSRADQVLIVEEVAHSGLSEREKLDIMVTLIKNPTLTLDGKASMLCFIDKGKLPAGPGQELLKTMVDYPTTRDVDDIFSEPDYVSAVRTDRVVSGASLVAPPSSPQPPPAGAPAETDASAPGPVPERTPPPAERPSTPVITPIPVQ